jgi:hypothetical protein
MLTRLGAVLVALAFFPLPSAFAADMDLSAPDASQSIGDGAAAYFEAHGGIDSYRFHFDPGGESGWDGKLYGVAGAAAWRLSPAFSTQVDSWAEGAQFDQLDPGAPASTLRYGLTAHLTWHSESNDLFGGFVSVVEETFPGIRQTWGDFGLEAVHFTPTMSFYGQVGYRMNAGSSDGSVSGQSTWFGHGTVKKFVTPNFVLSADGGAGFVDSPDSTAVVIGVGGGVEYKPSGAPFSAFVYSRELFINGENTSISQTTRAAGFTLIGGVRLMLGAKTLQDLNRDVGLIDMNR